MYNQPMKKLCLIMLVSTSLFVQSCELEKEKEKSSSLTSNTDDNNQTTESRSHYLGFTPWLYEATLDAQTDIYNFIGSHGDLIAHHLDGGVPWPEAVTANNFESYNDNVKNEINGRVSRTSNYENHVTYLAVSPFNSLRTDIAPYWGSSTGMSLPSPWDTLDIGNEYVVSAFANFVDEGIKKFDPEYVNYAIEINEYYHNQTTHLTKLTYFCANVYTFLKNKYPNKKFMVSFVMKDPGSTTMTDTATLFNAIKDYVDIVGISAYPYAFFSHTDKGDPENLPSDWLSQIESVAPNKPYFIAETGWVGEDLSIPEYSLSVDCDEEKQDLYVRKLFEEATNINAEGIVWFTAYDFDNLWTDVLGDNLSLIWRDTGLKDGSQNRRKALSSWETELAKEKK